MARRFPFITTLEAGELSPDYLMRTDSEARNAGAKTFRNAMLKAGGGFQRRWGTVDLAELDGLCRLETIGVGADDAQILVFADGLFEVRDLDGTLVDDISADVPWVEDDLFTMQVAVEEDRVIVASRSFFPQVLTLSGGSWTIDDFTFADGINGAKLQPYWRFAAKGVSLTVGAYTGSGVSLTTSAAFFTADHVGARIRYCGIDITITAVTNSTTATGTIVGSLYPTVNVTVASSTGFLVDQEVQGDDTQIRGVVASIVSSTVVRVQLTEGYTTFDAAEKLVGPTAKSQISGVATHATPAPTVIWDEQMISAARGYPGACALHRARLLFGDFPEAKNALVASATGDITSFDTGTGLDDEAILEVVARETSMSLKHFAPAEQLLMLTEAGPYHVPEQVAAPLSPTNYDVIKIGPERAAAPAPVLVSEGVMFSEADSGRLLIAQQTGNVRKSWDIADLSELAPHLMGTPVEIDLMAAGSDSDRQLIQLRDDGKIAAMTFRRGGRFAAWGLWETTGSWRSIVSAGGSLFAVAERELDGVTVWRLERFTAGVWCDGQVELASLATAAALYADETVGVWDDDAKIGEYAMNGSGVLQGVDSSFTAVQVGLDFEVDVETMPPVDPEYGLRPNLKITRVDVDVIDSVGFKGNGKDPSGWTGGTIGGEVVKTTGVRRFRPLGRGKYPTFRILQTEGGPLEVRSITMEVTS